SGQKGLNLLNNSRIDLVIVYTGLADLSGAQVIDQLQRNHPGLSVIVTGHWANDRYPHELHYGAYDFMAKPFEHDTICETTECALQKAYVFSESSSLRDTLNDTAGEFGPLLSKTPAMHEVFETIRMVSRTDMTVFLEGEAGTGKELVANAIHHQSSRHAGAFIPVNCAGFPDSLLEIELFGCKEVGPFGASLKSPGKIKLANRGTLFVDEIETMDSFVQTKFLQVLEDCNSVHLGGQQSLDSNVRVIAASHVPLQDLVAEGKMRLDLYYRINVVPIHILPLRERAGDIPLLIDDFLRWHPIANQKRIVGVSREAIARLIHYQWPGNIRELQNVLEKAIVLTNGSVIENVDLPFAKEPVN
ncbi:MAG TPA: sigma-54 dependent transcriptional regulator, partial [Pyrinomonadaceae bacterium]|nr:sigma-54 dependent transcriptional regulator [Pyrinomonadaceae bacterium]